jgi:hypothetical protein
MTLEHSNAHGKGPLVKSVEPSALLPDQLSSGMSRTARYLWRNGFVIITVLWPLYKSFEKLTEISAGQGQFSFQFSMPPLFFMRFRLKVREGAITVSMHCLRLRILRVRVTFSEFAAWSEEKKSEKVAALFWIIFLSLTMWVLSAPITILWRVAGAMARSWSTILKTALTSVPVLLAILVVIFTTGDAWRLFGNESAERLVILVSVILAVAVAAMINGVRNVRGGWRNSAIFPLESGKDHLQVLAERTPAKELGVGEIKLPAGLPLSVVSIFRWLLRANIYVLFWFTLIAQVFSVAALVAATFVAIGGVAVDTAAARDLLGGTVTVLWRFDLFGQIFIITRPLLQLSIILGCIASLTLVTANLQDPQKREDSLKSMLMYHRQSVAALSCYLATISDLLTMDRLRVLLAGAKQEGKRALLRLIENALERADPALIDPVLKVVREIKLEGWAGTSGISILAKIPPDKLRALSSDGIEFVLAAAGRAGPDHAEEIQLIRTRTDRRITNWRRQWTTREKHPGPQVVEAERSTSVRDPALAALTGR